ncbi:hypothetical protein [Helicobacter sp. T3_23-1056]
MQNYYEIQLKSYKTLSKMVYNLAFLAQISNFGAISKIYQNLFKPLSPQIPHLALSSKIMLSQNAGRFASDFR